MDTPALRPATSTPQSAQEWEVLVDIARTVARSGFLPQDLATPEKAAAIILKGRELGIPAMQSVAHIHAINGKLTCSAELMLALLARGGITWEWTKDGTDDQEAAIEFRREGFASVTGRFAMDDAKRIETVSWENGEKKTVKLAEKEVWRNYPANLLRARAIANGARMIGPDLLTGMSYTPEELGATVDEEGTPHLLKPERPQDESSRQPMRPTPHVRFLHRCAELQQQLGTSAFHTTLEHFGVDEAGAVAARDTRTMKSIVEALEVALEDSPTEPLLTEAAA